MIDSISGFTEPCSRGTSTQYNSTPTSRNTTNANGTANNGSMPKIPTIAERDERAQHQDVAVRKVDDAHDAEHEIEPDPDQAEIEPEQDAGDQRIDQHQRVRPQRPVFRLASRHGRG